MGKKAEDEATEGKDGLGEFPFSDYEEEVDEEYRDEEEQEEPEGEPEPEEPEQEEPEQEEEQEEEGGEDKEDDKHVPTATLVAERKKYQARIRQMEQEIARFTREREIAEEVRRQTAKPEVEAERPPRPDPEVDPVGALKYDLDEAKEQLRQVQEQTNTSQQATEQQRQRAEVMSAAAEYEQVFAAETADYYDALNHVRQAEYNKLAPLAKAKGATEQQIRAYMGEQELQAAAMLMQAGINPAEYFYTIARDSYGFTGPKPTPTPTPKPRVHTSPSGGAPKTTKTTEAVDDDFPLFNEAMAEAFGKQR